MRERLTHQQSSFADHHLIMNPPSSSSSLPAAVATLKSLETILHGMWRALVLTCALLWIFIFYSFLFLWENSHAPIDLWNSAFLRTAQDEKDRALESNCKLMELDDEARVRGHSSQHGNCDINGTSSISRDAPVNETPSRQITKYELITRNEVKCRDGFVKDQVLPVRSLLPLLARCDDHSNHSTFSNKLELSFTFAPSLKVKGPQVKSPKSKGWEICIEESCVQVVKKKVDAVKLNNNGHDGKRDKVTQCSSNDAGESQSKDGIPPKSSSLLTKSAGKSVDGEDAPSREVIRG